MWYCACPLGHSARESLRDDRRPPSMHLCCVVKWRSMSPNQNEFIIEGVALLWWWTVKILWTLDPNSKKDYNDSVTSPMRPNKLWTCPATVPLSYCPWLSTVLVAGSVWRGRRRDQCSWRRNYGSGWGLSHPSFSQGKQGEVVCRRCSMMGASFLTRSFESPVTPQYQFNKN